MNSAQRKKMLQDFLKSKIWQRMIVKLFTDKIGCTNYFVSDEEDKIVFKEETESAYCQAVKAEPERKIQCQEGISRLIAKAKEKYVPIVEPCMASLLGFAIPLLRETQLIGVIHGCQIIDSDLGPAVYQGLVHEAELDRDGFPTLLKGIVAISPIKLKKEIELINFLSQSFINLITASQHSLKSGLELKIIPEFYRIFKLNEDLIFELETDQLYSLVVDLIAKSMNAETCSLMWHDSKSGEITIKAAVGISELAVKRTKLKAGEGVIGHVIKTGKPLLIKDLEKDIRFKIKHKPDRYYTKSLIIAPLQVNNKVIGAININNEATRRSFNENDVSLLSILCNYAASAIEASLIYHRKEELPTERKGAEGEIISAQLKEMQQEVDQERARIEEQEEELVDLRSDSEKLMAMSRLFDEVKDSDELKTYMQSLIPSVSAKKEGTVTEKSAANLTRLEIEGKEINRLAFLKREIDLREKLQKVAGEKEDYKVLEIQAERLKELRNEANKIEEWRAKAEEFNLLYEITSTISSIQEPKEILRWVLERIQAFFSFSHVVAFLFLENKVLHGVIKSTCPLDNHCLERVKEKLDQDWLKINPADKSLKRPRKRIISVEKGEHEVIASQVKQEMAAFMTVILKKKGKIFGLMNTSSLNPEAFNPLDRRIFAIVANQTSLAIERALLFLEIMEAAEKDELTHVYNYRYFNRLLGREFTRAERYKAPLSLIMLDCDYLKKINDQYGHDQGNRVIKHIARFIKHRIRETDYMARFGGDEFGIILPETEKEGAIALAEQIRKSISKHPVKIKGQECHLSVSLGVATYPDARVKSERGLLKEADQALYQAKEAGRNRVGS